VQHRVWRTLFTTGGTPLVMAMLTKTVLQVVIRAWDGRVIIAMKQATPVTAGHFQKVREPLLQRSTVPFRDTD
jgi:hypothetical protein